MTVLDQAFLHACEVHSVSQLRTVVARGFDVRGNVGGENPVSVLVEMYYRSDDFPACLRLLLEAGGVLEDSRIAPVLLNDAEALSALLTNDPGLVHHRTSLRCAFTPLVGATLLHVAAEYGNLAATEVLLAHGAEVDARAGVNEYGLNGQTPLFHTVNSHANRSAPVMELLLAHGARTDVLLPGIGWGAGYPWATTCFDVTPIGYAQAGSLPQFQRKEEDIAANVRKLLASAGRRVPADLNVPNRYLKES